MNKSFDYILITFYFASKSASMAKVTKQEKDHSTEEKIKIAARKIFHQKGFAATRTRDIAEESGINLALLNYYFRSKEKLFEIIMSESLEGFFSSLSLVFNDPKTSFEEKIDLIIARYIDSLTENPNIPIFILSELRNNPQEMVKRAGTKKAFLQSFFLEQFHEEIKAGRIKPIDPLHFVMNILGLTVFPFVGSPMLKGLGNIDQPKFETMMEERKKLIPIWIKTILKP